MFLLITAPHYVENETSILEQVATFDSCMIHVRKPDFSKEQMKQWLSQFSNKSTAKMILHQHHQLCADFPLRGIHFKEYERDRNIKVASATKLTISAAYHDVFKARWQSKYHYAVLSPVFDSISKANHKGKHFHIRHSLKPIIALGGITSHNMKVARDLGFKGVAVLGSVWQEKYPFKAFKDIEKTYQIVYG